MGLLTVPCHHPFIFVTMETYLVTNKNEHTFSDSHTHTDTHTHAQKNTHRETPVKMDNTRWLSLQINQRRCKMSNSLKGVALRIPLRVEVKKKCQHMMPTLTVPTLIKRVENVFLVL